jgi:hypothetical protein
MDEDIGELINRGYWNRFSHLPAEPEPAARPVINHGYSAKPHK